MGDVRWPGFVVIVLAVAAPAAVAGASVGLRASVDNTNVALAVAAVIVVVAFRGGLITSALASVSGAVAFDLFQTRPYGSLRIAGTRDSITTLLLLAVGLLAGLLEERERAKRRREADEREDFARLQRFARLAAGDEQPEDLVAVVEAELADLLGLLACRFESAPFDTTLPRLERQSASRHKLVVQREEVAPGWGPDHEVELPVRARGHQLGRFVLSLPTASFALRLPAAAREVAFALADQLGAVLAAAWAAGPALIAPDESSDG